MSQLTISDRLRDPFVMKTYREMIRVQPLEVVKDLRKVLQESAPNHPRTKDLEQAFIERLGE
jgi:hypothetical protein